MVVGDADSAGVVSTEPYWPGDETVTAWNVAVEELIRGETYWLATLHPAGRPHVVPLPAVWVDATLHFAAAPGTRKARNLDRNPALTLAMRGDRLHVVIEGTASRVADSRHLEDVRAAYASKYGWEVTVRDSALHGEGAPTAGWAPYYVFKLCPWRAFGLPTDGRAAPTRWRFEG